MPSDPSVKYFRVSAILHVQARELTLQGHTCSFKMSDAQAGRLLTIIIQLDLLFECDF